MTQFIKMNGNGNDFVIIDSRQGSKNEKFEMTPKLASWIAYRRFGIGCDQIIMLEDSKNADVFMRIYNADGSESGACGNATRCVADLLMNGKSEISVETRAGVLVGKRAPDSEISVNMGEPSLDWERIPLAREVDCLALPIEVNGLSAPVAVSMGNPHMVFFVPEIGQVDIGQHGPGLENHELFPERANVTVAEIRSRNHIISKTWERGVGKTLSCGTAACATLVAAVVHELADPKAVIEQPGGKLTIEWLPTGEIIMTGRVAKTFHGEFTWDLEFKK